MANNELTLRALRLKEIFNESGIRTVSQFAKEIGVNQSTMANFFTGLRDPSDKTLEKVLEQFPQYNRRWLMDGTGEKYNNVYVEVREDTATPGHNEARGLSEKLTMIYDKLVNYMERCQSLEEQLRAANEMIEHLKNQKQCGGKEEVD